MTMTAKSHFLIFLPFFTIRQDLKNLTLPALPRHFGASSLTDQMDIVLLCIKLFCSLKLV